VAPFLHCQLRKTKQKPYVNEVPQERKGEKMNDLVELELIDLELTKARIIAKKANFEFLVYLIEVAIIEARAKICTNESLETLISTSLNDNGEAQIHIPHV
jgi:hypothetical protein